MPSSIARKAGGTNVIRYPWILWRSWSWFWCAWVAFAIGYAVWRSNFGVLLILVPFTAAYAFVSTLTLLQSQEEAVAVRLAIPAYPGSSVWKRFASQDLLHPDFEPGNPAITCTFIRALLRYADLYGYRLPGRHRSEPLYSSGPHGGIQ